MPPRLHVPYTDHQCLVALDFFEIYRSKTNFTSLIPDAVVEENSNAIFYLLKRRLHFADGNFRRHEYFWQTYSRSGKMIFSINAREISLIGIFSSYGNVTRASEASSERLICANALRKIFLIVFVLGRSHHAPFKRCYWPDGVRIPCQASRT
jgi:hypothetical protein